MPNGKIIYTTLFLLLVMAGILGGIIFYTKNSRDLKVIFFDVGQGDAILISQGNNQILIDGGKSGKTILEKLGKYVPFWDRDIEMVVATHPDQDHIGGLVDVVKSYNVGIVLETSAASESQTYQTFQGVISEKSAQKVEAVKGVAVKFPEGAEARVIYPFYAIESPDKSSTNQYSVVMKLKSGEDSFLFTGDLPSEQELVLIRDSLAPNSRVSLGSRVLKVAHHGSKYSTSDEFLNAVKPEETIISVGNNSYGHPAREVLDRLLKHGVKVFRTDEMGDIVYKCNPPAGGQNAKCKVGFE